MQLDYYTWVTNFLDELYDFLHYRNFAVQPGAVIVWKMNHHILLWLHRLDLGIFWVVPQPNCTVLLVLNHHIKGMYKVEVAETKRTEQLLANTCRDRGNKTGRIKFNCIGVRQRIWYEVFMSWYYRHQKQMYCQYFINYAMFGTLDSSCSIMYIECGFVQPWLLDFVLMTCFVIKAYYMPPVTSTNLKAHGRFWEANFLSANQNIPVFYGTKYFFTAFTSMCLAGGEFCVVYIFKFSAAKNNASHCIFMCIYRTHFFSLPSPLPFLFLLFMCI